MAPEQAGAWLGIHVLGPLMLAAVVVVAGLILCQAYPNAKPLIIVGLLIAGVTFVKAPAISAPTPKPTPTAQAPVSALGHKDIPPRYLALYRSGAHQCRGLRWGVLAGIGKVESNHGRARLPGVRSGQNFAGAAGPMQFGNGTGKAGNAWARYGRGSVYEPANAIPAAARYLCAHGAPKNLGRAVWGYNHDWGYVRLVLGWADRYEASARAADLLGSRRVQLTANARADLQAGRVNPRLVALLVELSRHHSFAVSVFKTGHTKHVEGTRRISNHYVGRGVDLWKIDGGLVRPGHRPSRVVVRWLGRVPGASRPSEIGSPFRVKGCGRCFTDGGHQDHIHIGLGRR